ncbi:MAG: hypothetical protein AB3N14_10195 [Flavobacteriaceae bacterium]
MNSFHNELKGVQVRNAEGKLSNFSTERAIGSHVVAGIPAERAVETTRKITDLFLKEVDAKGNFEIRTNDLVNLFWLVNGNYDLMGAHELLTSIREEATVVSGLKSNSTIVKNKKVEFHLVESVNEDTFPEDSVIATRFEYSRGKKIKTLTMSLKNVTADIEQLGEALLTVESALEENKKDVIKNASTLNRILIARNLIVRHGKLTVFDKEGPKTTFFINDRGFYIEYPGLGPSVAKFMATGFMPPIPLPIQKLPETRDKEDMTVFMEENVVGKGPMEHWYSPFSNLFALLNPFWDYLEGIDEFIEEIDDLDADECIEKLRIHSHGNAGKIRMGKENITPGHFHPVTKLPLPGKVKDLLDKLKAKMCNPSEIIFDACGQGGNTMLRDISNYLGPNVTVSGFSGTGNPFTGGDLHY